MAAQHSAALEAQEQVLPASLDGFEAAPVQPLSDSGGTSPRMHCVDGQPLPYENAKPRRCAMDGVTFGHNSGA